MKLLFYKYQGTGNDFVILDNRNNLFDKKNKELIAKICHRKFGVGADGLLLLENSNKYDFKMIYYNADGNQSSMCGNGGRCIVAFSNHLKIINNNCVFEAIDGLHYASIKNNFVKLQMINVSNITIFKNYVFLDTGSPHYVTFTTNISKIDVYNKGKEIRNSKAYFKEGVNVNFVEQRNENTFKVRTYERGVEDETLSCGTGVTAVAIAAHKISKSKSKNIILETIGGKLEVSFEIKNGNYKNVFLKGLATLVFKGTFKI
ncbi:MAG: diaminopimelate epimerase [Flavobacteriaceae bacterium]|nr:diaminopimelate epimerase [Flavobacteriaceae bacterium]